MDGTIYDSSNPLPSGFNTSGFDFGTGLGAITATVGGAGTYNLIAYFDHEIDETDNTFFNEYGSETGALAIGQSYEIDEPGYVYGDILHELHSWGIGQLQWGSFFCTRRRFHGAGLEFQSDIPVKQPILVSLLVILPPDPGSTLRRPILIPTPPSISEAL